jgi:hypothetical protein
VKIIWISDKNEAGRNVFQKVDSKNMSNYPPIWTKFLEISHNTE